MSHAVIIEPTDTGSSTHAPNLPGGVATGPTLEQVQPLVRQPSGMHLQDLAEDAKPTPKPGTQVAPLEPASPESSRA